MCTFTNEKIHNKTFTGYKYAVKIDGKYYSPVSGIEYKVGKVTVADDNVGKLLDVTFKESFKQTSRWYNKSFIGYTSVFTDSTIAKILICHGELLNSNGKKVLLQMTISGKLMLGIAALNYETWNVVSGKKIVRLKEISC